MRSVRSFVETVRTTPLPPIRALVCNAGLQVVSGIAFTDDGVEMTFGVNHLGHFALVTGILDWLARPARIVVVSSGTHDPSKHTGMPDPRYTCAADLAHPPTDQNTPAEGRRRYTTSKLCNVLFTYELDRRLDHGEQGVMVNAFDPGLMPGPAWPATIRRSCDWRTVSCRRCCASFPSFTAPGSPANTWRRWRSIRGSRA